MEHEAQEAYDLVEIHPPPEKQFRARAEATFFHIRIHEPGADPLRRLPPVRRCRFPGLSGGQSQVGQEMAQVERRLGLADGVEVDQAALVPGEEELRGAEIAMAETSGQWLGCGGQDLHRVYPQPVLASEAGGEAIEHRQRL